MISLIAVWFRFIVATFQISGSYREVIGLLSQLWHLSSLTCAEFLLFVLFLWRFWFLQVQTGVLLLVTEQQVSQSLILLTDR